MNLNKKISGIKLNAQFIGLKINYKFYKKTGQFLPPSSRLLKVDQLYERHRRLDPQGNYLLPGEYYVYIAEEKQKFLLKHAERKERENNLSANHKRSDTSSNHQSFSQPLPQKTNVPNSQVSASQPIVKKDVEEKNLNIKKIENIPQVPPPPQIRSNSRNGEASKPAEKVPSLSNLSINGTTEKNNEHRQSVGSGDVSFLLIF